MGYNRDGTRGKRQIVIGLLCDTAGRPLSVEVFRNNTADMITVAPQIKKVAERCGAQHVTCVGDRGMITHAQKEDVAAHGMSYITALTKPHIEHLLREQRPQMELFDGALCEVYDADKGTRYVLRRVQQRVEKLGVDAWVKVALDDRVLRADVQRLLEKAGVKLPQRLALDGRRVHTKTRLRRKRVRR